MFLIYINDIPERIKTICKIFADDTSLFPVVKKDEFSQNNLNSNLKKLSYGVISAKIVFNHEIRKQATEVYFWRKLNHDSSLPLDFTDNTVQIVEVHSQLRPLLDKKLGFNILIENKLIGIMKRLSLSIFRDSLLTIYKWFVRPHLDYADIIHGKHGNVNFEVKLEKLPYNACFAMTGAIWQTNRGNIYAELGL